MIYLGVHGVHGVIKIIFKNEHYSDITSLVRKTDRFFPVGHGDRELSPDRGVSLSP